MGDKPLVAVDSWEAHSKKQKAPLNRSIIEITAEEFLCKNMRERRWLHKFALE